jgi:succinate dehydrogenase/fumarate reductase-like Fe-S protein
MKMSDTKEKVEPVSLAEVLRDIIVDTIMKMSDKEVEDFWDAMSEDNKEVKEFYEKMKETIK